MMELLGYTLANFQTHHTAMLTIVILLYITSPILSYLITESLCLLATFIQFPSSTFLNTSLTK